MFESQLDADCKSSASMYVHANPSIFELGYFVVKRCCEKSVGFQNANSI